MQNLSVVIIAKNAAHTIGIVVEAAFLVTDEVIVVDSGSTDDTISIAKHKGASVVPIEWQGYGHARNFGAELASNDYILNLDSDEQVTPGLAQSIANALFHRKTVYGFKRLNFLGDKPIKFGVWGSDKVWRIYNKNETNWNLDAVHEMLELKGLKKVRLAGKLNHYSVPNLEVYKQKLEQYAKLSAIKYKQKGKKAGFVKRYISPAFSFVKYYVFGLGFLNGADGWHIAKAHYIYNKNKYRYFRESQ